MKSCQRQVNSKWARNSHLNKRKKLILGMNPDLKNNDYYFFDEKDC